MKRRWVVEVMVLDSLLIVAPILVIDWSAEFMKQFPEDGRGEIMAMIGLILAGSVAGNFSLTYRGTELSDTIQRCLAHATKFFLQFSIAWNLMLGLGTLIVGAYVDILFLVGALLYSSILLFNIWDILRASSEYDTQTT